MKTIHNITATLTLSLLGSIAANASEGVRVEHLGINNTLVRVEGSGKYLMFPVQEAYDDATVNVVVDGKLERTFYVRLAKSKVDYSVPFDLTPYNGRNVVFDIVTSQNRTSIREAREDACWNRFELTDTFDTANREKYRPAFHHTPVYGWMNDPNGMFYKDGVWHLYYQWNPYGSKWQNTTWGHSSSTDLVHWTHHHEAIVPNGLGSVFSGSAAIDVAGSAGFGDSTVVAIYTSAGTSQMQSIAWSTDNGMTFNIYPGNPVLTLQSEARDPNMFWNPQTRQWTMVLAHALEHEMLFFTSSDMKNWTLQSSFGKGLGAQGGVWECPDLFKLPVDGSEKWVLICNINPGGPFGGSGIQYFTGDFDGTTFTVDNNPCGDAHVKWLDYGKDNYALVSWSDAPEGRRTAIGWMSNWQYAGETPTMQFRSANTLPREISLFKAADGQVYAASAPSPELESLRGHLSVNKNSFKTGTRSRHFSLPAANDGICEILFDIEAGRSDSVTVVLDNAKGEKCVMTYNTVKQTISFDRTESGICDFSQDFPAVTVAPAFNNGNRTSIRLFVDRSSMEVFINGGRSVMTNLVFPTEPYSQLSFSSHGGNAIIRNLKIYNLNTTL